MCIRDSPWGGVCAVPQFINSFDEDDARLEDNYIPVSYTHLAVYKRQH